MIKTSRWTGGTEEEYETQHFGFGAQRLKIAMRQMVEQKIRSGIKEMESYLQESLELNDTDKATLIHSCNKLIRLHCERAGPSLEIIDGEIEKILQVPPHVLLPEDEVQLEQISDEEYVKLKDEVATLRKRVERGALMEAFLQAEDEELSSVEKVYEMGAKDMESLDLIQKSVDKNDNMKTIQSATDFLCAIAPFLKKNDDIGDVFDE